MGSGVGKGGSPTFLVVLPRGEHGSQHRALRSAALTHGCSALPTEMLLEEASRSHVALSGPPPSGAARSLRGATGAAIRGGDGAATGQRGRPRRSVLGETEIAVVYFSICQTNLSILLCAIPPFA